MIGESTMLSTSRYSSRYQKCSNIVASAACYTLKSSPMNRRIVFRNTSGRDTLRNTTQTNERISDSLARDAVSRATVRQVAAGSYR